MPRDLSFNVHHSITADRRRKEWLRHVAIGDIVCQPMTSPRSLWHHADFMKLWTGQTISELGSHITGSGLQITAVMVLGATPTQMGLLAAMMALPSLLFGLI